MKKLLMVLALFAATAVAEAQSFNVDFGSLAGPTPTSYGAAANQPGVWNIAPEANNGFNPSYPLLDLSGASTSAVLVASGASAFFFDDPATTGADEALLDDQLEPTVGLGVSVTGLDNGSYEVWVYAFGSDDSNFLTSVAGFGEPTGIVGGVPWTGAAVVGDHVHRYCIEVTSGTMGFNVGRTHNAGGFPSCNGFQLKRLAVPCPPRQGFCNANGPGGMNCGACPCGNDAPPSRFSGCSTGSGFGAELLVSGSPTIGADTLRFRASGIPSGSFGLLVSADNRLPNTGACPAGSGALSPAFDGLRCVGGNLIRHGIRMSNYEFLIGFSTPGWGPPHGPMGGLVAQDGSMAGQTRHFQVFYRQDPSIACGTGQNTTNGVSVTFQ